MFCEITAGLSKAIKMSFSPPQNKTTLNLQLPDSKYVKTSTPHSSAFLFIERSLMGTLLSKKSEEGREGGKEEGRGAGRETGRKE